MTLITSWGRYPTHNTTALPAPGWRDTIRLDTPLIPYGNGRSYGDVCLNHDGHALPLRGLNKILSFDTTTGLLHAEAGITLAELHPVTLPHGWFVPVTPGTQFVTLGGAIANDVHGKNHHVAGTFCNHVQGLTLLRSAEGILPCNATANPALFRATLGGLGLTGIIRDVTLQLRRVPGALIAQESIRFSRFAEFFQLSREAEEQGYEYTVAWLDCLHPEGRGIFFRGNHTLGDDVPPEPSLPFPVELPFSLMNRASLWAFNTLYYHRQRQDIVKKTVHWKPFFYPLDGISNWNRLYGRKGFLQHQCVIPHQNAEAVLRQMLKAMIAANSGSFLAVLKQFGDIPSPALLSFPMPGITLALDFPFHGEPTLALFRKLNNITIEAGGRLYPAKDATMTPWHFQTACPHWQELEQWRDHMIKSSFWRRVTKNIGNK